MYDLLLCRIPKMGLVAPNARPSIADVFEETIPYYGDSAGEERHLVSPELIAYLQCTDAGTLRSLAPCAGRGRGIQHGSDSRCRRRLPDRHLKISPSHGPQTTVTASESDRRPGRLPGPRWPPPVRPVGPHRQLSRPLQARGPSSVPRAHRRAVRWHAVFTAARAGPELPLPLMIMMFLCCTRARCHSRRGPGPHQHLNQTTSCGNRYSFGQLSGTQCRGITASGLSELGSSKNKFTPCQKKL